MKVPIARALADAAPRLLDGDRLTARESVPVKTALKKLNPLAREVYLQFAHLLQELPYAAAEPSRSMQSA